MEEIPSLQDLAIKSCIENGVTTRRLRSDGKPSFVMSQFEESSRTYTISTARKAIRQTLHKYLEPGRLAVVTGLQKNVNLNGSTVKIRFWIEKQGRWAVQMMGTNKSVQIRPRNLLPLWSKQATLELRDFAAMVRAEVQRDAVQVVTRNNDRQSAWNIINHGYKRCPVLVWEKALEILDITVTRPVLVHFASAIQERMDKHTDTMLVTRMLDSLGGSSRNTPRWFYTPTDNVDKDEVPTLMWFLAYVQLDCEDFVGALKSLAQVIADIQSSKWSAVFLPEALYCLAVAEFGLRSHERCQEILTIYDSIANPLDRNRRDAAILQFWASKSPSSALSIALKGPLDVMKKQLSETWKGGYTFFANSWVLAMVAGELGVEYEDPMPKLAQMMEESWQTAGIPCPPRTRKFREDMTRPGYPLGAINRYREVEPNETEEDRVWNEETFELLFGGALRGVGSFSPDEYSEGSFSDEQDSSSDDHAEEGSSS